MKVGSPGGCVCHPTQVFTDLCDFFKKGRPSGKVLVIKTMNDEQEYEQLGDFPEHLQNCIACFRRDEEKANGKAFMCHMAGFAKDQLIYKKFFAAMGYEVVDETPSSTFQNTIIYQLRKRTLIKNVE